MSAIRLAQPFKVNPWNKQLKLKKKAAFCIFIFINFLNTLWKSNKLFESHSNDSKSSPNTYTFKKWTTFFIRIVHSPPRTGTRIRVYLNQREKSSILKVKFMIGNDRFEHKKLLSENWMIQTFWIIKSGYQVNWPIYWLKKSCWRYFFNWNLAPFCYYEET